MSFRLTLAALALAAATGCAIPSGAQVTRMAPDTAADLSGRWNDTDARLVAEEMIADSLAHPWLAAASARTPRGPLVVVQAVRNETMEHIDTGVFVEELQRSLINSGRVQFVAGAGERDGVRWERADQEAFASDETRKGHGREAGADFVLTGSIKAVEDRGEGQLLMLYQVNLKLLEVETNRIVWNGQKKIKKAIARPRYSM